MAFQREIALVSGPETTTEIDTNAELIQLINAMKKAGGEDLEKIDLESITAVDEDIYAEDYEEELQLQLQEAEEAKTYASHNLFH